MANTVSSFSTPGTVLQCKISIGIVVLRWASEVSTCQRSRDQLGEIVDTIDRRIEPRRDEGDLAGAEARPTDTVAHLPEHYRIWQGQQGLPGEPRRTGRGFQPRHQLVVKAQGFEPTGPWDACDRWRPPHTRPDKRPTWGEIHQLSRADAEHGMHARLHEQGEMGIGAQAPIGHEYIP